MYGWAWLLTIAALGGMFPWARWALRREPDKLLIALLTLALSFGTLSLSAFWIGWLGQPIGWRTTTLAYAIICVLGWGVWWRSGRDGSLPNSVPDRVPRLPINWLTRVLLVVIGIMAALILFNALYWPISVDDAVAIYGLFGKQIATTGRLPLLHPGVLYETYPMALPLIEAYVFQAAGWFDSQLAALAPALLSIGTFGVAYLIGRTLYNRTVGIIAAFLIAITPSIAYWSSTSYVDLPAGFFYGLAWLFVIRYHRHQHLRDAVLCGIMAGLSAWTKNSGLLIVGSLGLWVFWLHSPTLFMEERNIDFTHTLASIARSMLHDGLWIGIPFLLVCGPWYARSLIQAGWLVPPTGWTFAAQRTVMNLFPYLTDIRYWPSGVAFSVGIVWIIWQALRSRGRSFADMTLLIGYVPFFVIWWILFSYENRFLLVLTPLIAVMGGVVVEAIAQRLTLPSGTIRRWILVVLSAIILLSTLPAASAGLLFKNELIHQLFARETDKERLRFGGRYDIGLYLQTHLDGCAFTTDTLLPYLAYPGVVIVGGPPNSPAEFKTCHYWMFTPDQTPPAWFNSGALVMESGHYRLYTLS